MSSFKKRAYFDISPEFVIDALGLPEGTEIYGATWEYYSNAVRLWVTHDGLPLLIEGESPSHAIPSFKVEDSGKYSLTEWGVVDKYRLSKK